MQGSKQVIFFVVLYFSFANSTPTKPKFPPKCQECHALVEGKINVHLIPHSHDDVGWLKTFSEYYKGDGMFRNYENAGVQYIISSTIEALKANLDRRFIQVETAFFYKWWLNQTQETRDDVHALVISGQLELVNGAWSMNDEAATNYQSTIDQFTWGFRILDHTAKVCAPKIAWQIDPFGHSREHASLIKQFGFEGLVVGRIDYRDKARRIADQSLDFTWKTSNNLDDSELLTSMFPDFYGEEKGFQFDVMYGDFIDDSNLETKVAQFTTILDKYAKYYQTPNIMMPMGSDFTFQVAERNFKNIDQLIKGFKNHEKYNVFYSTPSCYFKAVQEDVTKNSVALEQKTDDFFPYASKANSYWTGYFTSRPTAKRFERTSNNILQSLKQLTTISRINNKEYDSKTLALRQALGVVQHHDAITGTAKQAVANDYDRMLYNGIQQGQEAASNIILDLLKKDADENTTVNFINFSTCLLANISICVNTQKNSFLVAVQNPLGQTVTHYVRLPVDGDSYKIMGPDGEEPLYDIFDTIHTFDYVQIPESVVSSKELIFVAKDLPPLGIKLYHIFKVQKDVGSTEKYKPFRDITSEDSSFGTKVNGFTIDTTTGKLSTVTLQGVTQHVTQEYLFYPSGSSGAYLFRPSSENASPVAPSGFLSTKFVKGNLVDEYLQVVSEKVTQIIRVYKNEDDAYIEFDWLVGNLTAGEEIISRFVVQDFNNEEIFYTDSNGREQIKRKLNSRGDYEYDASSVPVESNYYPITSKIVIKDEKQKLEVAVLNDRAQGGSSLTNGNIELMVHRRLTVDDSLGVNEILNEEQFGIGLFARGQHYLTFGKTDSTNKNGISAAAFERQLAQKKLLAPWVLVSSAEDFTQVILEDVLNFKFEGLSTSLPKNVHILTLEPWTDSYILRLEHFLEKDEDAELSKPVTVDLDKLFTTFNITEMKETTLGANKYLTDEPITENFSVILNPMQIRTFIFKTDKNNEGGNDDNIDDDNDDDDNNSASHSASTIIAFVLFFAVIIY